MDQIAAGKGRAPKPFMLAKAGRSKAGRGLALQPRRSRRSAGKRRRPRRALQAAGVRAKTSQSQGRRRCRISSRPQLCKPWSTARRSGDGWVPRDQVRRLPRAAARRGRRGHAEDPQRSRLDRQVPGDRQGRRRASRCDRSTARSSRSMTTARRISLRCRRRCPTARPADLIFFAFDLLFAAGEDLRRLPLAERKERLEEAAGRPARARTS